ncbi:hypothetical protein L2W58_06900 [Dethiosulfovibrio sp. F2B]|uniref:hypothetical protein n=1 Tax=Dethiosulfovibrio faecalis TaxID=2720018 RepID=UPI001F3A7825|nr:hypothetical protein [Dethiosulfovibrio faecalis]MCF4151528.1 hypothetical protein [Dethiosulfovibrio faecalis]
MIDMNFVLDKKKGVRRLFRPKADRDKGERFEREMQLFTVRMTLFRQEAMGLGVRYGPRSTGSDGRLSGIETRQTGHG